MDLSQQSITGHEFDLNRRGYDPDAVDAHLREIAAAAAVSDAEMTELRRTITELQAKVQDADESQEALRLTLKAAAHAKEELLAGARETAQALEQEATEKAQRVVAEAEATAATLTEQAEAKALAMTEGAGARAREVAKAALSESELLVVRIEQLRAQVDVAEESLRAVSADASPRLQEARNGLDQALEAARASAENPELLAAAAAPVAGPAQSPAQTVHQTPAMAEPHPTPAQTPEAAADGSEGSGDGPEGSGDGPDSGRGEAPFLVAAAPGPDETETPGTEPDETETPGTETHETDTRETETPGQEFDREPDQQPAAPDDQQAETSSDISDKVDRLLEELREVT